MNTKNQEHQPWYAEGLKFECTACGNCCRTHGSDEEYAYVYLAAADVRAVAPFLKLSEETFLEEYCQSDESGVYLKSTCGDCLFLDEKSRCRIYPVRPGQCATWPFWHENLIEEAWKGPVTHCCPGVGKGRLHSAEEILAIANERERRHS